MAFGRRDPSDFLSKGDRSRRSAGPFGGTVRHGVSPSRLSVAPNQRTYGPDGSADPFALDEQPGMEQRIARVGRFAGSVWSYGKTFFTILLVLLVLGVLSQLSALGAGLLVMLLVVGPMLLAPWILLASIFRGGRRGGFLRNVILAAIVVNIVLGLMRLGS